MRNPLPRLLIVVGLIGVFPPHAARAQSARSLQLSVSNINTDAVATGDYQPPTTLIANRSKVLAGRASGAGREYFSTIDLDLVGKTSDEAVQRLSPAAISADDKVRTLYVQIELRHPWKFVTTDGQPAHIGTAIVDSSVHHLDVNTSIFANSGLTVISK